MVGQADDSTGWLDTDQTGTASQRLDARLGPLRDNGGPTPTHALLADSPAIARGDPGLGSTSDQRGTLRSFDGGAPDIGAFEAALAQNFRVVAPMQVAPGQPFNVTVIALDRWGNTASTYTRSVRFSSSDSDAVLPEDYTFSADDGGQQVFAVTLQTPGRQTLTVADPEHSLVRGEVTVDVAESSAFSGTSRYFWAFLSWEIDGTSDRPRRI